MGVSEVVGGQFQPLGQGEDGMKGQESTSGAKFCQILSYVSVQKAQQSLKSVPVK